jgi:NDP-sugar pyrophosphorylase family protein
VTLTALSDVPVAILAGGLATRLRSVAPDTPKALVDLCGRPFIDHQLALLERKGLRRVVMCLGHLGERIRDHVGDGASLGLQVSYSFDGPALLGTGGALRRARAWLGELFFVQYGDSLTDCDYKGLLATLEAHGGLGVMAVLRNRDRWDRSNVLFRDGRLLRYDKRQPTADMDYIDYGVGLLRGTALDRVAADTPSDVAELYSSLVTEGLLSGYEVTTRFYEIGTPEGLADTRRFLEEGTRA